MSNPPHLPPSSPATRSRSEQPFPSSPLVTMAAQRPAPLEAMGWLSLWPRRAMCAVGCQAGLKSCASLYHVILGTSLCPSVLSFLIWKITLTEMPSEGPQEGSMWGLGWDKHRKETSPPGLCPLPLWFRLCTPPLNFFQVFYNKVCAVIRPRHCLKNCRRDPTFERMAHHSPCAPQLCFQGHGPSFPTGPVGGCSETPQKSS